MNDWITPAKAHTEGRASTAFVDVLVLYDATSRSYAARFQDHLRQRGFFPAVEEWTAALTLHRRATIVLCVDLENCGASEAQMDERVRLWAQPRHETLTVILTGLRRPYDAAPRTELGGVPCFYDTLLSEREFDLIVRVWRGLDVSTPLESLARAEGQLGEYRRRRSTWSKTVWGRLRLPASSAESVLSTPIETAPPDPPPSPDGTQLVPDEDWSLETPVHRGTLARDQIRAGVVKLARAVKVTLGPRGRNVIIQGTSAAPTVTQDGATVARAIELEDAYENMGASLVRDIARRIHSDVGDGATTATVLAEAIFEGGYARVVAGANPVALGRGIAAAAQIVTARLARISESVPRGGALERYAAHLAGGTNEVGTLVVDAMRRVGSDGIIDVSEGLETTSSVEWVPGTSFEEGYASPHFATDAARMTAEYEDVQVALFRSKIVHIAPLVPMLEVAAESGRPLLILAQTIEGEALAALVVNRLRGTIACVAGKIPGFGARHDAWVEDLATLTGATPLDPASTPTGDVPLSGLVGRVKRIVVTKDRTTLIDCGGEPKAIRERTESLRAALTETTDAYEVEALQQRIVRLDGGIARIRVCASSDAERSRRKERVARVLDTIRAATEEGVVPGGGLALLRCARVLGEAQRTGDEREGVLVVQRALRAPLEQIARNAGDDATEVVRRVLASDVENFGYDATSGAFVDVVEAGILDATKVVRSALQLASSVAALLLTTDALVTDVGESAKTATAVGKDEVLDERR